MSQCDGIVHYLDEFLRIAAVEDVSCNGLQVQGPAEVSKVGLAVDACMATYAKAADEGCGMLLAHHGLIWGGLKSLTGARFAHVRYLIENGIGLYAAHLPLDLHPEVGNNVCLARLLGLSAVVPFGSYKGIDIGFAGVLPRKASTDEIAGMLGEGLGGPVKSLPFGGELNGTVGIVSGGGSDCLEEAIEKGIDCFVTGEPDHRNHHQALEGNLNVIYCGHYHSEQLGVKEVGRVLTQRFGVETVFLDEPTLV
jgi:dinuclear metal center YbgI/SA1388 family protein